LSWRLQRLCRPFVARDGFSAGPTRLRGPLRAAVLPDQPLKAQLDRKVRQSFPLQRRAKAEIGQQQRGVWHCRDQCSWFFSWALRRSRGGQTILRVRPVNGRLRERLPKRAPGSQMRQVLRCRPVFWAEEAGAWSIRRGRPSLRLMPPKKKPPGERGGWLDGKLCGQPVAWNHYAV